MKKIILMFVLILMSCEKDDTALKCLTDCTVVQGQLVTANGEPLKNIPVAFSHYVSHGIGGSYRRIKKTETDKNGFYRMEFFIEEDELGKYAKGLFELKIDYSELDPRVYMNTQPFYIHTIYSIAKRDTTMTLDFYNPKKAFIKVNLNDFKPTAEDDFFAVSSIYPTGLKIGQNEFINSEYQLDYDGTKYFATSINTEVGNILVAESDYNIVCISKRKNGEEIIDENHIIFVPEEGIIELTFIY